MKKHKKVARLTSILLVMLLSCAMFGVTGTAFASTDLATGTTDITISTDDSITANQTVSNKTVTIDASVTLTVESGVKLTINTDATFIINGTLLFEDGADSDIKGEVRINDGGVYRDNNADADWAWNHGDFTGDIYIQKGGELTLNNTLYVGELVNESDLSDAANPYFTVMAGNWAADNDLTLDRLRIKGKTAVYVTNGITSINKTIAESKTWNVGGDAHVNLCANNSIKFAGPTANEKARINTFDSVNSKYYGATNNAPNCEFLGNSTYSWVSSLVEGGPKKWLKVGPYVDYTIEGLFDLDTFMNLVSELSFSKYDLSANHGGSTWNGAKWEWDEDTKPVPTNDAGGDGIRYRDIKYTERVGTKNGLDLYIPAGYKAGDDIPLVVHMYGGGWTSGTKSAEESTCARFAKMGYAVAAIDYRLAGYSETSGYTEDDGNFFDMIDDIEDGVKAAKAKIEELGYVSTKMATTGGSAGAHLSMMYAYTHGKNTTDRFGNANALIPVEFCMTNCGPADFSWMSWQYSSSYVPYVKFDEDGKVIKDENGNLIMNTPEEQKVAGANLALGLLLISETIDGVPVQGEFESDEDFKTRYNKFIEDFLEEEMLPWTAVPQAANLKIAPAAMIEDAITNPSTSIYHNVPTLGLYGGQDTLCHSASSKKLIDALALDPSGRHQVVFSSLMGHTLAEDYSAILENYNKTNEFLEQYLRNGEKQVVFKADDKVLKRINIAISGNIVTSEVPSIPAKTGHTTVGWNVEPNETALTGITDNLTFTAVYTINKYKITFMDGNTKVVEKTVNYGGKLLVLPAVPEKEGYTGAWDITDFSFIESNMTVNAVYTAISSTPITYTITFMNGDEVIDTKKVNHGETLADIPAAPEKKGYTAAWDVTDFTNITGDMVVNIVYTPKSNMGLIIAIIVPIVVLAATGVAVFLIVQKRKKDDIYDN